MAQLYSECSTLAVNCHLYTNNSLTDPAPAGFYSNGTSCYAVTGILGIISAITPCPTQCDVVMTNITSTDPTTVGGTNGTITITFTGTHGPYTYTKNAIAQGAAVSPLVVTGLSSSTPYTIVIKDANNCTVQAVITLGQTATVFDADWIMVTYEFTDGVDLDTRSRIAVPNIGQDTQPEYVGYGVLSAFPGINTIIRWGSDNRGTGFESILIDVAKYKLAQPSVPEFIADLRAVWWQTVGTNPVKAAVTLWKGGTPIKNGCGTYCWTNPTATLTRNIASVPKVITLYDPNVTTSGQRVATLKYNTNTFVAVLNNADVTTPSV